MVSRYFLFLFFKNAKEEKGVPIIVMELANYGSIQSQFGKGTLPPELKIVLVCEIAKGMKVYLYYNFFDK